MSTTYWDLSVYIAGGVLIVAALVAAWFIVRTLAKRRRLVAFLASGRPIYYSRELFMYDSPGAYTATVAAIVAAYVVLAGGIVAGHYPLEAEYHQWRAVSGEVERIESRFTAAGSGTSQAYVAVIDGTEHHLTDSRAALVSAGDDVNLMCKRQWQYGAASILTCRWGGEVVNR